MEPTSNPVWDKINSFLTYGAVSGDELEKLQKDGVEVKQSYDEKNVGSLSLNCVSSVDGIARSLFDQAANSALSVTSEEQEGSGGIIDNALERNKQAIVEQAEAIKSLGIQNVTTIESGCLKTIICKDPEFLHALSEKAHQTVLFVFDLPIEEEDIAENGCKETRKSNVSPKNIKAVIVPNRYEEIVRLKAKEAGIPQEKFIFVNDVERQILVQRLKNFAYPFKMNGYLIERRQSCRRKTYNYRRRYVCEEPQELLILNNLKHVSRVQSRYTFGLDLQECYLDQFQNNFLSFHHHMRYVHKIRNRRRVALLLYFRF